MTLKSRPLGVLPSRRPSREQKAAVTNAYAGHYALGNARGLTLIELMIATGILVVALTGLSSSILASMASANYSKSQTIAMQDARTILEQLTVVERINTTAADAGTLLEEVADINAGTWGNTPWAAPTNLNSETVTVYVVAYGGAGAGMAINVNALPAVNNAAAIPTATNQAIELIVVVNWIQGARPVGITVRTLLNDLA